ncbi:dienelactone hydrolase family protein [Chelativorans salis]|uniref:Alpha/beta hydrolase n=1 Tax=Chelativorans salis TaxID=2978478 RepID=A0ABT2LR28_9HYPH|nr:alpha/beta hydrolase [Chelativorans sp. EGI FJ00035]MCT7377006.1 alpha/beta hydrolase [Chelativorans sp. EGI FJ00035]
MATAASDLREVRVEPEGLNGFVGVPPGAQGIVIFAHGSGSGRLSPRNNYVATELRKAGLATFLLDLLTPSEDADRRNVFDIPLLASRLERATRWTADAVDTAHLKPGYFGASTGAAAALTAAADAGSRVAAIVSRGGRPDMALPVLSRVRAPTLLLVGSLDGPVIDMNRQAHDALPGEKSLIIVEGAGHLFEEPGKLDEVVRHATNWFLTHLTDSVGT